MPKAVWPLIGRDSADPGALLQQGSRWRGGRCAFVSSGGVAPQRVLDGHCGDAASGGRSKDGDDEAPSRWIADYQVVGDWTADVTDRSA